MKARYTAAKASASVDEEAAGISRSVGDSGAALARALSSIEDVQSAIDQIAQTTLRKVVGQHSLDQTLSETDKINLDIRKILDVSTVEWALR
jgi:regulator of protease activity HflC (stomatin/prohibitin superfamily)